MAKPRPTPTALKLIRGNPGKRKLNQDEPTVDESVGAPPTHLDKLERKIWNETAKVAHWLTAAERGTLEVYVTSRARLIRVKPETERALVVSQRGGPYQNPYLAVENKAKELLMKSAAELGLTPASRRTVSTGKPKEKKTPLQLWKQKYKA